MSTVTDESDINTAAPAASTSISPPGITPKDMVWIPGGTLRMGSDDWYPEERPVHTVSVDRFWMDEHEVTVAEFRRFVRATNYITVAERPLDPTLYPDADPDLLVPVVTRVPSDTGPRRLLKDFRNWWTYVPGAKWNAPEGPGSNLVRPRHDHPVTQVSYEDAETYAKWVGKALPTEAEWEFAARGGLDGAMFTWGDEHFPDGKPMANTWQGEFPWQNLRLDGYFAYVTSWVIPTQRLRAV